MKNLKRILAGAGALLLLCMYLATLVFALMDSPNAVGLLKASIACTIIVPVFLYAYILVYRLTKKNQENDENKEP